MTYGMLRHGMMLALLGAIVLSASACGREGKNGEANPGSRANQSGPASPFGLNTQNNNNLNNNFGKFQNGADALKDRTGDGAARGTAIGGAGGQNGAVNMADRSSNDDNVTASQELADAIVSMHEVRSANVLMSGQTAFVAVVLHAGSTSTSPSPATDLSNDLKNRIADKVKATNGSIRNVYISSSPDFVSRVDAMRQDIAGGRPVAGFVRELYNMAERLLPTRAGSNNPVPPSP